MWSVLGRLELSPGQLTRITRSCAAEEALLMYSILYIIGAIVVIIVVLKVLGLY